MPERDNRTMNAPGQEVTLRMAMEHPSPWELVVRGEIVAAGTHASMLPDVLRLGVEVETEKGHLVAAREMQLILDAFNATIGPVASSWEDNDNADGRMN